MFDNSFPFVLASVLYCKRCIAGSNPRTRSHQESTMDAVSILDSLAEAKKLVDSHRMQFAQTNTPVWNYLYKVGEHITRSQSETLTAFLADFSTPEIAPEISLEIAMANGEWETIPDAEMAVINTLS